MDMFKMKIKFLMVFTMALFVIIMCGCDGNSYSWNAPEVRIVSIKDYSSWKDEYCISIGTCDTIYIESRISGFVTSIMGDGGPITYYGEIKKSISVTPDIGIISLTHLFSNKSEGYYDYYRLCGQKAGKVTIKVDVSSKVATGSRSFVVNVVDE